MYWWGWVLAVMSLFGILTFLLFFIGAGLWVRITKVNPRVSLTLLLENLAFKSYIVDIGVTDDISNWKLAGDKRGTIKCRYQTGFFKKEEMIIDTDDFIEFTSDDGRRKHIIAGLKHLKDDVQLILAMKQKTINRLSAESALNKLELNKLRSTFDSEIDTRLKQYKELMPTFIKPPKK